MTKRARLAHARKAAGYTQESLAEALGVDRSTVVRWEAGDHEPLPYLRPRMAGLLAISRKDLSELLRPEAHVHSADVVPVLRTGQYRGEAPAHDESERSRSSMDDTLRFAGRLDGTLRAIVELSGEDLKRRNFLLGATFATAAFAEPALFALTAPAITDVARDAGSRCIGMTDVEILTDHVAHLRRMDFRYGSGRIREKAVQLLHHEAITLLRGSYSDSTGRELLTAVAQATRLAASMAADVGRHALAQRYYSQALNLAMDAGNRLFAGTILSDMSRLTIQNAAGQRCALHAVALARAGKTMARNATPTLAAQLSAVEARAHALCQDTRATRISVLDAEQNYERFGSEGEPVWLSFYNEAELAADLGRALRDSRELTPATRLLTRALDTYEPWRIRSCCFVQTDLAATYLIDGDYECAAALTRNALNTAAQVSSDRTTSRIRALQQQIRSPDSVDLAELDEEITNFLLVHDNGDSTT